MRKRNIKTGQFYLGSGVKVNNTAIAKSGKKLFATGDNLNNIMIWYMQAKLEPAATLSPNAVQTNQTEVQALTFSFQQQQVISGSNRGIINIWDLNSEKIATTLRGHSTVVSSLGIFKQQQNKNRLISGSYDTNIKLWDLRTKNNTNTLKGHTKQIKTFDISPDSNLLISGSEDSTIKLWDLRYPQKIIFTYTDHSGPVNCLRFNPQQILFASGSSDKTAKYFRCEPNQYNYQSSTQLMTSPVTCIQFDSQGKFLFTAGTDILKVWNMAKGGAHVASIQSYWKGVQDICVYQESLNGICFSNNTLSIWVYLLQNFNKKQEQKPLVQEKPLVLPRIQQNRLQDLKDVQNNINMALGLVNNIQRDLPKRGNNKNILEELQNSEVLQNEKKRAFYQEQLQKKKLEIERQQKRKILQQKKREEQLKKKQQEQRKKEERERRIKQQKQRRQREQQERKQIQEKQRKQREERERQKERQRKQRENIQRQKERQRRQLQNIQRQKQRKERQLYEVERFNQNMAHNYQQKIKKISGVDNQIQFQNMEQSVNISAFMGDQNQKQKFKQFDIISSVLKSNSKYESIMNVRKLSIKPILNWWNGNSIKNALYAMNQANIAVVNDALYAILNNPKLKSNITPQIATNLIRKSAELMNQKQASLARNGMIFLNQFVLMYKDQIIKLKTYAVNNKVDLTRQQRIAKYDRLIEQFLCVFKMQRLIKYSKQDQSQQLPQLALVLFKNLEELLRKCIPKNMNEPIPC